MLSDPAHPFEKRVSLFICLHLYIRCTLTMLASPAASRGGNPSNRPPNTLNDSSNQDDDNDDTSQQQQPLQVEEDDEETARAAAAVSVMSGARRQRPPGMEAADAAIQGNAAGDGGEAQAFEVVDEGGELVRVRFHEFLQN